MVSLSNKDARTEQGADLFGQLSGELDLGRSEEELGFETHDPIERRIVL
ncbi:MAG TPA: hypothetical protein PK765_01770 [bacterium]|nr:hypothetical protein [bacterium]